MWKPILVLILFILLLTACSTASPTFGSINITEADLVGVVKQDTSCYRGPDSRFGIATELKKDFQISIVGASERGDYVVINDPLNIGICWAELKDIGISSEDLLAEFMKLNTADPDSSDNENDMACLSPILVKYHCPGTKKPASGEEPEPPTLTAGQALHKSCNDALGLFGCHSSAAIDSYYTDCGELVYPAYYILRDDCEGNSDCVTSTPPPVEFIACTPIPTLPAPMILNLTLCWNGPGPGYDVISSLQPNTSVDVLGTGLGDGYIVITNPRYDRPCWVKESDIKLNGLNVAEMPIFGIPEQDGPADSPDSPDSPVLGCWVAGSPSVAPKCIKPCPDPVAYPNTCDP